MKSWLENRARVTTLPNDPEAIAALTEGEKKLSEKNPRAAEASFKSVLAKYPKSTARLVWPGHGGGAGP